MLGVSLYFCEKHWFWFFPTLEKTNMVFFLIIFRFVRTNQDITLIFLIKLVFKHDGFQKCDNRQFSFLIFTIRISNLWGKYGMLSVVTLALGS